jgi:hypothetical protein
MRSKFDTLVVWLDKSDEHGVVKAVITAMDATGQDSIVAAEEFGPFDTWEDITSWVWKRVLDAGVVHQ